MRRIFSPFESAKLIKKRDVIASMMKKYVSLYLILGLYEKPCATNHALYLIISLFSLRFLYEYSFVPNKLCIFRRLDYKNFVNEFDFAYIVFFFPFWPIIFMSTFFHILWFKIFIIFYDIRSHLESKNIVNNNIILIPFFLPCVHNLLSSHNFLGTCTFVGVICLIHTSSKVSCSICVFSGASCSMCAFSETFCFI